LRREAPPATTVTSPRHAEDLGEERGELGAPAPALGRRGDPHLQGIAEPAHHLGSSCTGRHDDGEPRHGYHPAVAERAAVERDLEEIGTQLAWVRDYL